MNEQFRDFQARIGRIDSAYAGRVPYAFTLRQDGLIVPKAKSRLRFYFPLRALLAGFVTIVMVKGFLLYYLGDEGYRARMDVLMAGSEYQELAAAILMPDPVSEWTAAKITMVVGQARHP